MVMRPEPWGRALDGSCRSPSTAWSCPTPAGRSSPQGLARRVAGEPRLVFACGRYEGIDQRVADGPPTQRPTRGVASATPCWPAGRSAVLVIVEAVPGCCPASWATPSRRERLDADGLLEAPVLHQAGVVARLRGPAGAALGQPCRHRAVAAGESLRRTAARRPDLLDALPEVAHRADGPALSTRMADALPVRPAARVFVLDPEGRVLLFGARLVDLATPPGPVLYWYTPGGQVEPGRSACGRRRSASWPRRSVSSSIPRRWRDPSGLRRAVAPLLGGPMDHRETYFVLRDVVHEVDVSGADRDRGGPRTSRTAGGAARRSRHAAEEVRVPARARRASTGAGAGAS